MYLIFGLRFHHWCWIAFTFFTYKAGWSNVCCFSVIKHWAAKALPTLPEKYIKWWDITQIARLVFCIPYLLLHHTHAVLRDSEQSVHRLRTSEATHVMCSMGEVHAGNVHSRLDHLLQHVHRARGGPCKGSRKEKQHESWTSSGQDAGRCAAAPALSVWTWWLIWKTWVLTNRWCRWCRCCVRWWVRSQCPGGTCVRGRCRPWQRWAADAEWRQSPGRTLTEPWCVMVQQWSCRRNRRSKYWGHELDFLVGSNIKWLHNSLSGEAVWLCLSSLTRKLSNLGTLQWWWLQGVHFWFAYSKCSLHPSQH